MNNQNDLLRTRQVCQILNINRNTFYMLVKKGYLEVVDLKKGLGKRKIYRVSKQSLEDYINSVTPTL